MFYRFLINLKMKAVSRYTLVRFTLGNENLFFSNVRRSNDSFLSDLSGSNLRVPLKKISLETLRKRRKSNLDFESNCFAFLKNIDQNYVYAVYAVHIANLVDLQQNFHTCLRYCQKVCVTS